MGGVVGGLAVVGIAVVLIFWLIFRHRRDAARAAEAAVTDAKTAQPPFPGPPDGSPQPGGAFYPSGFSQSPSPGLGVQQPGPAQFAAHPYYEGQKQPEMGYGQMAYSPNSTIVQPQHTGTTDGGGAWHPSGSPQPVVSELGANYVLGSEGHRAELGH